MSDESGRNEVYVQEYPTPGRGVRISTGGGDVSVWAPRSDGLYYRSLEGDVFYAPITVEPELGGGTPERVLERAVSGSSDAGFDIAPDGQSFVTMKDTEMATGSLELIVNWFEELRRRVPTEWRLSTQAGCSEGLKTAVTLHRPRRPLKRLRTRSAFSGAARGPGAPRCPDTGHRATRTQIARRFRTCLLQTLALHFPAGSSAAQSRTTVMALAPIG